MSEQLELDTGDTEEEQTEKGLDKVIQAQEERNKKDYEENKYRNRELQRRAQERKNQQLDIPGMFEADSGLRTTLAIGTEVGLNTILDLFSADPTQLTQIFGAQGINYIAQRIRGGEFSRGEMIASGLASLLPGGAQAKSLGGTIGRTALRGGVSGAIETGAADLIDTGEIDAGNVVAGGAMGTTFGGLFGTAAGQKETKLFFKRLRARMGSNLDPEQAVFTPEELRSMGIGQPLMSLEDIPKKGFNPEITKKNLKLFDEIGFTGTNKLDIQDMLYGIDADGNPLMSQYKRRVLKAGIGDETFNWSAFTKNRDAVVKDFLDGLQDLDIDPKTIHGHHISALRITSSLFDGLSPIQRKKLIKIFQREGLKLGNHPDNLLALHKSTHLDVVHPFLEKQVGKYGQLLLDPAKMKKLNPRQREELVKKFAKIIKRSEEIAMESTQKWLDEAFENLNPQAAFDAKMDILNRAFNDDVAFRAKLLKSIKSKEPLLPYQAEDVEIPVTPKTKKTRVTSKQTKFKNLLKKIKAQNPNTKQMTIWDISEEALDAYRKLF